MAVRAGRAPSPGTVVSLALVALLGIWPEAMVTLSLVLTSLVFCIAIGLPLGIARPPATAPSVARPRSMPCRPRPPSSTSCRW